MKKDNKKFQKKFLLALFLPITVGALSPEYTFDCMYCSIHQAISDSGVAFSKYGYDGDYYIVTYSCKYGIKSCFENDSDYEYKHYFVTTPCTVEEVIGLYKNYLVFITRRNGYYSEGTCVEDSVDGYNPVEVYNKGTGALGIFVLNLSDNKIVYSAISDGQIVSPRVVDSKLVYINKSDGKIYVVDLDSLKVNKINCSYIEYAISGEISKGCDFIINPLPWRNFLSFTYKYKNIAMLDTKSKNLYISHEWPDGFLDVPLPLTVDEDGWLYVFSYDYSNQISLARIDLNDLARGKSELNVEIAPDITGAEVSLEPEGVARGYVCFALSHERGGPREIYIYDLNDKKYYQMTGDSLPKTDCMLKVVDSNLVLFYQEMLTYLEEYYSSINIDKLGKYAVSEMPLHLVKTKIRLDKYELPGCVIACDVDSCGDKYTKGIEVLEAYDKNDDGIITKDEALNATEDYVLGKLTTEEASFVTDCANKDTDADGIKGEIYVDCCPMATSIPTCGDDICSQGEDCSNCPEDCGDTDYTCTYSTCETGRCIQKTEEICRAKGEACPSSECSEDNECKKYVGIQFLDGIVPDRGYTLSIDGCPINICVLGSQIIDGIGLPNKENVGKKVVIHEGAVCAGEQASKLVAETEVRYLDNPPGIMLSYNPCYNFSRVPPYDLCVDWSDTRNVKFFVIDNLSKCPLEEGKEYWIELMKNGVSMHITVPSNKKKLTRGVVVVDMEAMADCISNLNPDYQVLYPGPCGLPNGYIIYEYTGPGFDTLRYICGGNFTTHTVKVENGKIVYIDPPFQSPYYSHERSVEKRTQKITLTLHPGWNLISSPLNRPLSLSEIEKYCDVLAYQGYKLWSYNPITGWTNPTEIRPDEGVYIYVESQCVVEVEGAPQIFTKKELKKGWNLISIGNYSLNEVAGDCRIKGDIWELASDGKWAHPSKNQRLNAGKGYWIEVEDDCTLRSKYV